MRYEKMAKILMATMKMDIGGAETHILEVSSELVHRGHEITVASNGGVFVPELEARGIKHIEIPFHSKSPSDVMKAYRLTKELLKKEKFDIVHAHARIPTVICGRLARKFGIPYVTTAHLTFSVNPLWKILTDWGEGTVAVSDDIKEYLTREYGVPSSQIIVTVNGISTDTYSEDTDFSGIKQEFSLSDTDKRIVHVSRIDTDRSLAALKLAEAAPKICEKLPDSEILIVGGGNDFAKLESIAKCSNDKIGKEYIKLIGARTDINKFIASGKIFIGVSRAALEAMAMARPTILAGNEGYLGIFTSDKFETAYESNFCCRGTAETDSDILSRDVCRLLSMSEEEICTIAKENKKIVEEHYSVKKMADDYLTVYDLVTKK